MIAAPPGSPLRPAPGPSSPAPGPSSPAPGPSSPAPTADTQRPTPSNAMAKRDPERDMDLDKKIEALRRKNAALMRRYQEVEEDKKMAEDDIMALQGRKAKADDLSITIRKSTSESRVVVVTKPCAAAAAAAGSPGVKGQQQVAGSSRAGGEGPPPGSGRLRSKQLTVTMAGKKGRRVVSERAEPGAPGDSVRDPDEDGLGPGVDAGGGAKHPPHTSSSKRDAGTTQEGEFPPVCTDLTVPTSPEEQEEYMCWKRERERIDRERVARHKNARGQWRRAWDLDKSASMFSDKSLPEKERGPSTRGGRNARRGHLRSHPQDSQGGPTRDKVRDKGSKNVAVVVSSKAKGKDRLTGRARRWDADAAAEPVQEEDDDDEEEDGEHHKDADHPKEKISPGSEVFKPGDALSASASKGADRSGGGGGGGGRPRGKDGVVSSSRGTEKRVRFSEELIQGAQGPAAPGPREEAGKAASSPSGRTPQEYPGGPQGDVSGPPPGPGDRPAVARQPVSSPAERGDTDRHLPPAERSGASHQGSSEPTTTQHAKCNISNRNTEELIDAGLSVLSLESRGTCSTDTANTDKARENGKIV